MYPAPFGTIRHMYPAPFGTIPSNSWGASGDILPDQVMTAAIPDRLLHHSVTLNIQGESYKLRQHRSAGLTPSPLNTQKEGQPTPWNVSSPKR